MDDIRIGDWSKLGATLRTRRLQLGLSQWEVSVQANVSRSWLARIEAGHRGAELEQLLRLLAVLQLTLVLRPEGQPATAAGAEAPPVADPRISEELRNRQRSKAAARRRAWTSRDKNSESTDG